jgi:hypothetical protein
MFTDRSKEERVRKREEVKAYKWVVLLKDRRLNSNMMPQQRG